MLFSFLKVKTNQQLRKFAHDEELLTPYRELLNFFDSESLYPDFHVLNRGVNETECEINGKKFLMFCSNNYLSLTEDEEVKAAAKQSIDKYGVGPGGSRAVSGTVDVIVELEKKIAALVGAEDCLTFPTGYMANVGVFKALMDSFFNGLPTKTDDAVIFSDEYNHGSIVDGCRLSRAKKVVFKHNDIEDLKIKIRENDLPNKLIVTEGVFSTEGEILKVKEYIALAKSSGALLMIDDAHGVGVLGEMGGGTPQLTASGGEIDLLMGSMDKALGGTGGYLCGKKDIIRYLRVAMSSSILSSAIPTVAAAAMNKSIDKIISAEGAGKRRSLIQKSVVLKENLRNAGFEILGTADLPAIPLYIGNEQKAIRFCKLLFEEGIFTSVFRWPAVPQGGARLRITLMANHTQPQINKLLEGCIITGKKIGVI